MHSTTRQFSSPTEAHKTRSSLVLGNKLSFGKRVRALVAGVFLGGSATGYASEYGKVEIPQDEVYTPDFMHDRSGMTSAPSIDITAVEIKTFVQTKTVETVRSTKLPEVIKLGQKNTNNKESLFSFIDSLLSDYGGFPPNLIANLVEREGTSEDGPRDKGAGPFAITTAVTTNMNERQGSLGYLRYKDVLSLISSDTVVHMPKSPTRDALLEFIENPGKDSYFRFTAKLFSVRNDAFVGSILGLTYLKQIYDKLVEAANDRNTGLVTVRRTIQSFDRNDLDNINRLLVAKNRAKLTMSDLDILKSTIKESNESAAMLEALYRYNGQGNRTSYYYGIAIMTDKTVFGKMTIAMLDR